MLRFKTLGVGISLFAVLLVGLARQARTQTVDRRRSTLGSPARSEFFRINPDGSAEDVTGPFGFVPGADVIARRPNTVPGWIAVDADGNEIGEFTQYSFISGATAIPTILVVVPPGALAQLRVFTGTVAPFGFLLEFESSDCSGDGIAGQGPLPWMSAVVVADGYVWATYLVAADLGQTVVTRSSVDPTNGSCLRHADQPWPVSVRLRRGPPVPMAYSPPITIQPR